MKVFIVVGARGQGKSTFVKKRIANVPRDKLKVYDVQGEYFPGIELPDIEDFLHMATIIRERVIVFEEATIFFSNRGTNKQMRKCLVRARHAKNFVFLLFHSIRSIPYYIYELSDYVVLFRTGDEEEIVQKKHKHLYRTFMKLRFKPKECQQFTLFNNTQSPYAIVKISPETLI